MDTGGGGKGGVKADINVTPLVDIVLVLLIIFIVITPAVNDAVRLPISRNAFKPEKEQGAKYLTLMLPAKNDPKTGKVLGVQGVIVDDPNAKSRSFSMEEDASKAKLVEFIKNSTYSLNDKRVFVKASADLPFKYVNQLFQICREGGADEASVVTSEDKSAEKKK
jgi:biopolymer transport protein TolR